jgi:site-specific recombinase XerD
MQLENFYEDFYRPLRLRGRSPETTRLYHCTIRSFGKWLGRTPMLADIADEMTLARYVDHRQATRSPYTAEKERSQLMSMARLANERRMIPALPSCPPCVLPDRIPTAWSEEELRRLFAAAAASRGHISRVPAGEWFVTLLLVAFETGERIGALLEVEPRHYGRPFLHIPAEVRKGGRRARVYELSEAACARVERLAKVNTSRLFAWDRSHTYLWDRLRSILARAGLSGKRLGFQQIRRSAISHLAAAGGDPVAFAGHAQAATTKRWYLDPRYAGRGPRPADLLPRLDPENKAG